MPNQMSHDSELPEDLDDELRSLVVLLNRTNYVRTIGSCAGYSHIGKGQYRRHRLVDDVNPYLMMEPKDDSTRYVQLQEHISKRLANAYACGISVSDNREIPPEVMASLQLYRRVDSEHLFWLDAPIHDLHKGYFELREFDFSGPMGIPRRILTPQDVLKVWQLLELAVREFVELDTPTDAMSVHSAGDTNIPDDSMVLIPAGEFQMGGDGRGDGSPLHTVFVDAFMIDVCLLTNVEYGRFMEATGHPAPGFWGHPRFSAPEQPVIGVSWRDAVAYCEWAGKRLPTEAEWEKAARGGLVGTRYPWGNAWEPDRCSHNGIATTPVTCFPPNGYGLHDMVGNVWEWCADWYEYNYYTHSPKRNPTGPKSEPHQLPSRVIRGGSWLSPMSRLGVTTRSAWEPAKMWYCLGFRCARDV